MGSAVIGAGSSRSFSFQPYALQSYEGVIHPGELLAWRLQLDRRVKPGRLYRVRATNQEEWLFRGRPVRLLQIRPAAYCYRLNFDVSDDPSDPDNQRARCVYTDSWCPAAIALTPVDTGGEEPAASGRRS